MEEIECGDSETLDDDTLITNFTRAVSLFGDQLAEKEEELVKFELIMEGAGELQMSSSAEERQRIEGELAVLREKVDFYTLLRATLLDADNPDTN